MKRKTILIADPDRDVLKQLGNALHDRGYDVRAARDGSKALEKVILVHPDVVLIDGECPMIPPQKFVQIIRSNPTTEDIPIIVMGRGESDESGVHGYREGFVRKPFNTDEIHSLLAATLRKMATAEEVREEGREIEGNLSQISLVDLLQIFNINRKTGLLEVRANGNEGHIYVYEGNVVHASVGKHRAEKSLFRLLHWRDGTFAFIPEKTTTDLNIRRSTDVLLLEGARQSDELGRLRDELPGVNVRLEAVPELKERYEGLHPVTQQIMDLLEFYNTVDELMEHSRVSDFETCRAIRTLMDKGALRVIDEEVAEPTEPQPLLDHDLIYELKVKLAETQQPAKVTRAKVCLLCPDETLRKEFASGMRKLPGMELIGQLESIKRGFGLLGVLQLSENFHIDWMLLPIQASLRPLWQPLGVGMVGGLVLRSGLDDQILYRLNLLAHELTKSAGVPVLQLSEEACSSPVDAAKVREVVVQLLHRIAFEPKT
jgi:CheY-like chemotaxis protein